MIRGLRSLAGRRLQVILGLVAVATILLWNPFIRPASKAAVILLDVYATSLYDVDAAGFVTPPPRVEDTRETYAGVAMRVTWWRPAWGDRHPAILLVNGATPAGNDLKETRLISRALARAGFLVMLPEFPFLMEDRFDPSAVEQIEDAFAALRARPEARDRAVGAYGFSVGGGVLLAAAGRGAALQQADYLGVLGAYYDIETYVASVVSRTQRRDGELEPWEDVSEDARQRVPPAVAAVASDRAEGERLAEDLRAHGGIATGEPPPGLGGEGRALWRVLAATDYEEALVRLSELPAPARARLLELSPRQVWTTLRPPVFWVHDPKDNYVPLAQAMDAAAAPRASTLKLVIPALLAHGEP
ncbi:MAG: hypothetical protein ACRDGE_11090, partial [Candidatus Limnocylindria bacterium]